MRRNRLGIIILRNNPYLGDNCIDDYKYVSSSMRRLNRYISGINFGIRLSIKY